MECQTYRSDERRSWHYPPPWEGVAWMPHPTPFRDLARRAAVWAARAFAFALIFGGGSLAMALIAVGFMVEAR